MAQATKAGHHLIGNIGNAVAFDHLPTALVVVRRRYNHPATGQNRFGDKAHNILCTYLENLLLKLGNQKIAECIFGFKLGKIIMTGRR